MSLDNFPTEQEEEKTNSPEYRIPFEEIKEKYKDVSLARATNRFRTEFFTPATRSVFTHYAKDSTLSFTIANDDEIPTAAIDPKTGQIMIGKSLALGCLDGNYACNKELMTFILGHEIGHYLDLYSSADKPIGFSQTLKSFINYLETLKTKINNKWGPTETDDNEDEDKEEEKINPIYFLYHELFNKLDDAHVNERAVEGFASLQNKNFDLPKIYETSLFKSTEYFRYQTLLTEQFGNYLLQKIMNPNLDITVDSLVQAELDKKYEFNGKQMNLEEILRYSKNSYKWNFAAKRYPGFYDNFFIPAFERLLEEDKKDREKLNKFIEELKKKVKSEQNPNPDGSPRQGTPDPFGDTIKKAKEAAEQAKKTDQEKINENRKKNEEKTQSDAEKAEKTRKGFARNVARENNLDIDKTTKYFEYKNELVDEIEEMANFLIAILLRNKTEAVTILEKRKKSGDLSVKNLIQNYSGILAGDKESMRVFEKKVNIEKLQDRTINLNFRLFTDNSGSTASFLEDLEKSYLVITHALKLANEKLNKIYELSNVTLNSEIVLFGNANNARIVKESDKKDDSDGDIDLKLLKGFNQITCDEGTCDEYAWSKLNNEWYEEGETEVKDGLESISCVLEVTDGYVSDPKTTKNEREIAKSKGIISQVALLENNQALDVSLSDYTKQEHEELREAQTEPDSEKKHKNIQEITKRLNEKTNEYEEKNKEQLKHNPAKEIWEEGTSLPVYDYKDILVAFERLMITAVSEVDNRLEGGERISLDSFFWK